MSHVCSAPTKWTLQYKTRINYDIFLLHVSALIAPSAGRTFLLLLQNIVIFCDYLSSPLLYSYLKNQICFIVELETLKSLCKTLKMICKCFCRGSFCCCCYFL